MPRGVRQQCQHGDNCRNPDCGFSHPSGRRRIGRQCKSGDVCHNEKCKHYHRSGRQRRGLGLVKVGRMRRTVARLCLSGDSCFKLTCTYAHPSGNDRKGLRCKSGDQCYNRDCRYFHTSGLKRDGLNCGTVLHSFYDHILDFDLNNVQKLEKIIAVKFGSRSSDLPKPDLYPMWSKIHLLCEVHSQMRIDVRAALDTSDTLKVKIKKVDREGKKISLTMANPQYSHILNTLKGILQSEKRTGDSKSDGEWMEEHDQDLFMTYIACCKEYQVTPKYIRPPSEVVPTSSIWVITGPLKDNMKVEVPCHCLIQISEKSNHLKSSGRKIPTKFEIQVRFTNEKHVELLQQIENSHLLMVEIKNLTCFTRIFNAIDNFGQTRESIRNCVLNTSKQNGDLKGPDLWNSLPISLKKHLENKCNQSQLNAVQRALRNRWFQVLGPPGSGKTTTAIHILNSMYISFLLHYGFYNFPQMSDSKLPESFPRIALLASSNQAVDEALSRIYSASGFCSFADGSRQIPFMLRIGNLANMREVVKDQDVANVHLLVREILQLRWQKDKREKDKRVWEAAIKKEVDLCKQKQQELLQSIKSTTSTKPEDLDINVSSVNEYQRMRCREQCLDLVVSNKYRNQAERNLLQCFFDHACIVFGTVNALGGFYQNSLGKCKAFDAVIIDESCQLKECESLIPLLKTKNVVWIGDPNQLRPVVMYNGKYRATLMRTLFERMQDFVPGNMLTMQYRMHPEISQFPAKHFYRSKLKNGANTRGPGYCKPYHKFLDPFQFIHVEGEEKRIGTSIYNNDEIEVVVSLLSELKKKYGQTLGSIGIITPYLEQKQRLDEALKDYSSLDILIDTVDAFQGAERDLILLSTVRTSLEGIGFCNDINRINVSITRARFVCCVIGNATSLSAVKVWKSLINNAKKRNLFKMVHNGAEEGFILYAVDDGHDKSNSESNDADDVVDVDDDAVDDSDDGSGGDISQNTVNPSLQCSTRRPVKHPTQQSLPYSTDSMSAQHLPRLSSQIYDYHAQNRRKQQQHKEHQQFHHHRQHRQHRQHHQRQYHQQNQQHEHQHNQHNQHHHQHQHQHQHHHQHQRQHHHQDHHHRYHNQPQQSHHYHHQNHHQNHHHHHHHIYHYGHHHHHHHYHHYHHYHHQYYHHHHQHQHYQLEQQQQHDYHHQHSYYYQQKPDEKDMNELSNGIATIQYD